MADAGRVHEEPIFFAAAFEALFDRTLRGRPSPELKGKLRAAGVDLDRPQKVAYPFKVWEDVQAVVVGELYPGVEENEAWFRLGQDFFNGYNATMIGKAAIAMARLVGLDRTLQRFTSNMRHVNNATEATVELRERGRILLRMHMAEKFREALPPAPPRLSQYLRGMLLGIMRGLGLADARVELVQADPSGRNSLYEMTWTER